MPESDLFISYSHKDSKWLERLRTHLATSRLAIWDDTMIAPGKVWKDEIQESLTSSKAAVLLVTQDFIASDFIRNSELPEIFESVRRGKKILWIAVSDSSFEQTRFLSTRHSTILAFR